MNPSLSPSQEQLLEKLEKRHISVREPRYRALTRIRATMLESIRKTLSNEGFIEIRVPTIASFVGSCENPHTLFKVTYWKDDNNESRQGDSKYGYLIQTSQLHLEALVYTHEKVYSINQSYRAEKVPDTRHLTEFTLIEVEAANYDLEKLMRLQEDLILNMARDVLEKNKEDLEILDARLEEKVAKIERNKRKDGRYFKEITYNDAIDRILETEKEKELNKELIERIKGDLRNKNIDIPREGETILMELHDNLPLFVTHYPREIKYFNMKDSEEFQERVNSSDLLLPGVGEVCGSAEREADPEKLKAKFEESDMCAIMERRLEMEEKIEIEKELEIQEEHEIEKKANKKVEKDFKWLFELGTGELGPVYHGGFGMGFERVVQWICNFDSILECVEFPRNIKHVNP